MSRAKWREGKRVLPISPASITWADSKRANRAPRPVKLISYYGPMGAKSASDDASRSPRKTTLMTHRNVTSNAREPHSSPIHSFAAQIMTQFIVKVNFGRKCFFFIKTERHKKKCLDLDSAKVAPTSALFFACACRAFLNVFLSRTCNLVRIF
jgi:hypothetical protein